MLNVPNPVPTLAPARPAKPSAPERESLAVLTARLAQTLEASVVRLLNAAYQNLGHLKAQVLHNVQSLRREPLQRAAQAKADAIPPHCPVCGQPLSRCGSGHARTFQRRLGDMTIEHTRGYCPRWREWRTPADTALGLDDTAGCSPAGQAPWSNV